MKQTGLKLNALQAILFLEEHVDLLGYVNELNSRLDGSLGAAFIG